MKIEFDVKYGKNTIEIPIHEVAKPAFVKSGMTDFWKSKVTIFNDIEAEGDNPRRFDKFVVEKCQITEQRVDKADGTVRSVVNVKTVTTKDVNRYKSPVEYAKLPIEERANFYTVQAGDIIVLGEIEDVVTNAKDLQNLQRKYEGNCFKVTSVSVYINGMVTDNITMTNA